MAPVSRFPLRSFILLTAVPAAVVGAGLLFLSTLLPECGIDEQARHASPDGRYDLVVFSRQCGEGTIPNTNAALIPLGESLPEDAASFVSVATAVDLAPRWDAYGNIEITLPEPADIRRSDATVADVAVIYR
jgi:hypothetical protein